MTRWKEKGTLPQVPQISTSDSGFGESLMSRSTEGQVASSECQSNHTSEGQSKSMECQQPDSSHTQNESQKLDKSSQEHLQLRKIDSLSSPDECDGDIESQFAATGLARDVALSGSQGCSKLGEDLLALYKSGVDTDVVILSQGHHIKAHK